MKRLAYLLIPLIALVAITGFRIAQKRAALQAQTAQRATRMKAPPTVSVAAARIQDVASAYDAVGNVEAPLDVKVAAKVTGRIDYLQAREGDRVSKGQVLVRINPDQVEAEVRRQEAALAQAQYRLAEAQINQSPANVSVATQIRQQEAALASSQADYEQASQNYQAQLDSADAAVMTLDAGVRSAQANLDNARARYKRLAGLYDKGFVSAQDVDDAKTAAGVQQAALEAAMSQRSAAQRQAEIVKNKGKADIAAADAKRAQAQASLDYAKANTAQTPAYQQSLAALRSAVAAAAAGLKSVQATRAETVLLAPFDGYLTDRYMDPGSVATAGQPIVRVQYMQQVWINVPVPEEVSAKFRLGMPAEVSLDTLPGDRFTGRITQVNPAADPQSRQFSLLVTLDNPRNLIKPGIFARVRIETDREHGATVVPQEAVLRDSAGRYVMVVDDGGVAARRSVIVGAQGVDVTAISSGVRAGEKVVTLTASPIKDGQRVRVAGEGTGKTGGFGSRRGSRGGRPQDGK